MKTANYFLTVFLGILIFFNASCSQVSAQTKPLTSSPLSAFQLIKIFYENHSAGNSLQKKNYTIAVFGDSMEDTMGENLGYLQKVLGQKYPQVSFHLYNYGIGGQNVLQGLDRLNQSFNYKTRHYPPLSELHPDILIIGSYAYNPFSPFDRDKHWLTLAALLDMAKKESSQVYLLDEIAPLKNGFGQGPNGVNWDQKDDVMQSEHINEQLQDTIGLSQAKNIPLINVYNFSLELDGFGNPVYVNKNDGIHPSSLGHLMTAEIISSTIKLDSN